MSPVALGFADLPNLVFAFVCVAILAYWAGRTVRLWRQDRYESRGLAVPLGVALLYLAWPDEQYGLVGVGAALILIGEFFPDVRPRRRRRRRNVGPSLPDFDRWRSALTPDRPDLELHLEETGARVRNVGTSTLLLHGWSPSDTNGWLPARADDGSGRAARELRVGEWARLSPWPMPNRGVRLWYARESLPGQNWVFRADWTERPRSTRDLN